MFHTCIPVEIPFYGLNNGKRNEGDGKTRERGVLYLATTCVNSTCLMNVKANASIRKIRVKYGPLPGSL